MISYSPLLCLDFYKTAHAEQYPAALTKMVSYYTPRMTRLADTEKVTMFGLQAFIQEYLIEAFNMNVSDQTRINLPPRIRMATLYAISQSLPHGGRVANTCNRSEDYVGYSTKFGDSAGDFSPLANLMVHEVIQIGHELLLPINLISKIPSDGLRGKTDEDNLGFTYAHLDAYIMYGTSGIEEIDKKIASMHDHNLHKLNPMPAYGTTIF